MYFYKTSLHVSFKYNNAPKILGHSHIAAPRKFFLRNASR